MSTQDADSMFHDEPQGLGENYQAPALLDAAKPAAEPLPSEVKPKGKPRDLTKKPLVTLDPKEYVSQVFAPFHAQLEEAIALHTATDYDIQTTAGMELARQRRRIFLTIRTSAENERKTRKAPIIEIGKLLDATCKELEAKVRPLEEAHDAIIKAEEARKEAIRQEEIRKEQERVNNITAKIEKIAAVAADLGKADSARLAEAIEHWEAFKITEEEFAEFAEQADSAVVNLVTRLQAMRAAALAEEQRQREEAAARQREKEERERIEAALAEERRKAADLAAAQARERQLAAERLAAEQRRAAEERKQGEERIAEERRQARAQQEAMAAQMAELQRQLAKAQAKPEEEQEQTAESEPEPSPAVDEAPVAPTDLAPAEMAWPEPFPAVASKAQAKPEMPSAAEIVAAMASYFNVNEATVRAWLCAYDFAELTPARAAA